MDTRDALGLAQKKRLDLVEVAPTARPPVCRICDYGKYKYELDKKKKMAKRHQSHTKLKEIKFHANVGEHDYQTKLRHAHEFLEHGHRVKFSLYFRGRENAHHELGFELMNRVLQDLAEDGQVDQPPRLMGKTLAMLVSPSHSSKESHKKAEGEAESEEE